MTIDPLIVDCYADDFDGKPDVAALVAAGPPWHGLILKATEGMYYPNTSKAGLRSGSADWFLKYWPLVRQLAGARYGKDFFRGAYHYAVLTQSAIGQADRFLELIDAAGGWGQGDLWPMVDVEATGNPTSMPASQIEDWVGRWTTKVKGATGRTPTLYGHEYLVENGVTSTMNCGTLCVARYASTLPASTYEDIGWQIANPALMPTVLSWQYSGDPDGGYLAGYPTTCPMSSTEDADISAVIAAGGGQAALDFIRANISH